MLHMNRRFHMVVTGLIFLCAGVFHSLAIYWGWAITIGPWEVPLWLRWTVILVAFLMALASLRHLR